MSLRDEITGRERGVEIVAAILLSITTVLTAWTAFQSAKWSGVQAIAFSEAGAARTESVRESTTAGQQSAVDIATFVAWAEATAAEDDPLASFLRERFRAEFVPAFEAWVATEPLRNPDAPPTPFAMDEYSLEAAARAEALAQEAEQRAQAARESNQRSDNYVLLTVLFAVVLFFVGVGTKFEDVRTKIALLAFASVGLVVGVVILATFPIGV